MNAERHSRGVVHVFTALLYHRGYYEVIPAAPAKRVFVDMLVLLRKIEFPVRMTLVSLER